MGSYGDCRTIDVDAPPERCFALMTDKEAEKHGVPTT
jgi:hypothetical protein